MVRYALSLKRPFRLQVLPGPLALLRVSGEHSRCLSASACIVVGAATVTPAENFVSPLSESSPFLRKHLKKKKKSVSPHRQSVHPSECSPTLPSSSGLCVRQIENEQQSTVGEVSQPLKVMALASRLAGPDNAVPSLPGSDSWLSKKKQEKKIRSLFLHVLVHGGVKLHFRCCRNIGSGRQQTCLNRDRLLGSSRAFDFV